MKLFYENQIGRSMIEMLGVLAIAGILSVGGIAGYTKAMYKYKLNQVLEQYNFTFSLIFENMDKWKRAKTDYFYDLSSLWKQMNILPEEMIKYPTGSRLHDKFNNSFYVRRLSTYIEMDIFIEKGTNVKSFCTSFYQNLLHQQHNELRVILLIIDNKQMHPFYTACRYEQQCVADMTMADISKICTDCHHGNKCQIMIMWNI